MFSGKTAVFDLLSGLHGVKSGHYHEEFDFFRVSGGLIDLYNSFENWSFMGVDGALKRFEKLILKYAANPKELDAFTKLDGTMKHVILALLQQQKTLSTM